jgi:cytochrome c5
MNYAATFLIVASAASLLACGRSEDVPAPASQPAEVETPQATSEPVAPVVESPQPEATAPAMPDAAPAATAVATPRPAPSDAAPAAKPAAPVATAPTAPAPTAPASDLTHGQQIYRQACAFCHDKGVAGAPKIGDAAAWSPRLAQGMETLYGVALRGKGAMPAKGGNPSLADADVKAAVDYLVAQAR